ncbi:efflux RND transporter periplasmic adaptor subunit [Fastidiosibacter lacustris]|uniref:efflux RND transporter periplasmic adaptor subunit n=1 Tax=Fastidiosibacter lacustris TaxID=2056695 RepID=UPI0013003454|nr:efflux RND transporter periplasmic adaptor subunit [Fastidiosibacter lacustris]
MNAIVLKNKYELMVRSLRKVFLNLMLVSVISFLLNLSYAQDKAQSVPTVAVNVGKVEKINVPETITAVGHMLAVKQVNLSFDNSGKLEDKYFKNGDRVLKGETVASLDDQQNVANLQALQAKLNLAKQTYSRVKLLEQSGAISKEDIDQKYAGLQQAQADVDQQKVVVNQDKLQAPFTGVLGTYQFDVGAYIAAGTVVVQLTQESPLKIRFAIPSEMKPKIAIGNEVELTTETYPEKTFKGIVNYISPTVNTNTGTLEIEAEVKNDDYLLSPGMFMSVLQVLQEKRPMLVLPDMAIQINQQGSFVYVVNPDHTVRATQIETGLIRKGWTQITKGLAEGQEVVTIGGNKLINGAKITFSDVPVPSFDKLQKEVNIHIHTKENANISTTKIVN